MNGSWVAYGWTLCALLRGLLRFGLRVFDSPIRKCMTCLMFYTEELGDKRL